MLKLYAGERAIGIDAVIKASKLCQAVFNKLVKSQTLVKEDASPVTVADFGAQAVVNSILHEAFPHDPIVGEEDSKDLRENQTLCDKVVELTNSVVDKPLSTKQILDAIDLGNYKGGPQGRFWTLDPIDGTKGFLRGEQFAVCLSLIVNGEVKVAIQGCPNLPRNINDPASNRGSLMVAVKHQGVFERSFEDRTETRVKVVDATSPSETSFCESVEAAHSNQSDTVKIADILNIKNKPIRMDSQCKYAVIARGDAGIYLRIPTRADYQEKIWDHAGGTLMVSEGGGKVTDIDGKELDFSQGRTLKNNRGIIATNGKIHDQVLEAVKKVLNK
ncbi:hypothetical protein HDV01_005931 [Terramyces sp. JEL0728]|nr:hypothetical protein HDV01_005931 [Terramyces sp. JEL0728]